MLELYYFPTPNGKKITILLEELGIPYAIKPVRINQGDQFKADYLKISPNNRMPALVDTEPEGGGTPISIFESGAIMMYVAEKAGRFFPQQLHKKYDVVQWVMWQMANQGPKLGEQGHFQRAKASMPDTDLSYPMKRFDDEADRLFGVMNLGLFRKDWLAAGEYTIADMICYPWAASWKTRNIDMEAFPHVKAWLSRMAARAGVAKGMTVGDELATNMANLSEEEKKRMAQFLGNQRSRPIPQEWQTART
jgi:GSH-dependent disulfide-bond oxidoreductase